MNQFHSLTIREVRPETRDAVSIAFDVPPELRSLGGKGADGAHARRP